MAMLCSAGQLDRTVQACWQHVDPDQGDMSPGLPVLLAGMGAVKQNASTPSDTAELLDKYAPSNPAASQPATAAERIKPPAKLDQVSMSHPNIMDRHDPLHGCPRWHGQPASCSSAPRNLSAGQRTRPKHEHCGPDVHALMQPAACTLNPKPEST